MPSRTDRATEPGPRLGAPIAAALAIKLAALTAIYFAFFAAPADRQPPDGRAAAVLFGPAPSAR